MSKLVCRIEKRDLKRIRKYLKKQNEIVFLAIINIGVNVALRYSDLSKIKFEDIKEGNKIKLKEKKTNKRKIVVLNSVCLKEIENLKRFYMKNGIEIKGYLFKSMYKNFIISRIDRPPLIQSINKKFKELSSNLGIEYNIGTHSLRKTWGYYYYKKTKNIGIIMKILNHSSERITLNYIGITQDVLNKVYVNFTI